LTLLRALAYFILALSPERSMPRCRVTRRVHFNAAHRLHNPAMTDAWNQTTYGECNNPNFHGHNYELELSVEGEIDPRTGYVLDLNHLKQLAQDRLLRHLDHKNLNLDVSWFRELIPTSENIALVCWRELRPALPPDLTLHLRLWETPRNYVDYEGG
jgi:6-pyruvoyltetrahydropterin/6-carboxytetrahydropterin synthase